MISSSIFCLSVYAFRSDIPVISQFERLSRVSRVRLPSWVGIPPARLQAKVGTGMGAFPRPAPSKTLGASASQGYNVDFDNSRCFGGGALRTFEGTTVLCFPFPSGTTCRLPNLEIDARYVPYHSFTFTPTGRGA